MKYVYKHRIQLDPHFPLKCTHPFVYFQLFVVLQSCHVDVTLRKSDFLLSLLMVHISPIRVSCFNWTYMRASELSSRKEKNNYERTITPALLKAVFRVINARNVPCSCQQVHKRFLLIKSIRSNGVCKRNYIHYCISVYKINFPCI